MINVYFLNVSKKRNSTYRPTTSDTAITSCLLKDRCNEDSPTFIINASSFNFNYAIWNNHYYFINSVTYVKNNLYEVSCELDVLATYKNEILSTTAFVTYSNISGGTWLPDDRLPVMKDCIVSKTSVDPEFFAPNGYYILTVLGANGCVTYSCALSDLKNLIDSIDGDREDKYQELINGMNFNSVEDAVESLSKMSIKTDLLGNAYQNAPSCIRSCIWVPFSTARAVVASQHIELGNFDTEVTAAYLKSEPITGSLSVNIPWHYTDWRRAYCEQLYLYLPLVGMINISTDSLTHATSVTVKYSYTVTDGTIAYQIVSGNEIIGSYGGSCASNYPIGINQQASAGEVLNSIISGTEQVVASSIKAGLNVVGMGLEAVAGGVKAVYDVRNVEVSSHPTVIGGVGGGAGAGLDKTITLYSVAHSTVIEPSAMASTMGVPTMKPLTLSSCSGYCQCANAHVSANAHSDSLDSIDAFINNGFYIE